ncbi:hypothetical protein DXG01_014664 [Tephrocybe rancida]|nr:hypothetical protein DXG01_014664 [Tephrocybe rancida]
MRLPQFTEADHSIDGLTPTDAQYGLDLSSFTSRDNNSLEDNNNDTSKTSQKRRKTRASTSKHNRDSEDSDYDAPKPSRGGGYIKHTQQAKEEEKSGE